MPFGFEMSFVRKIHAHTLVGKSFRAFVDDNIVHCRLKPNEEEEQDEAANPFSLFSSAFELLANDNNQNRIGKL